MAEKTTEVLAAKDTASCSADSQKAATDNYSDIFNVFKELANVFNYKFNETRGRNEGEMAENAEEVLAAKDTASCSADCQAATDEDLIDLATQDHNEALSELETVDEDEFELSLHKKNGCYKKDRHEEFIPIRKFSIDKLDPPYKDQEIVEVVKQMAALTVRLRVRKISSERPPYPYPPRKRVDKNGRQCPISGSGFVMNAFVYREEDGGPCPCSECEESASPRTSWGRVLIATAGHVIFDSFEAEHTTCHFDFDEDDTDIASIPSLIGSNELSLMWDTKNDVIQMFCCTHDVDFAEKLVNMVIKRNIHQNILTRKYHGSSDTSVIDVNYYHKMLAIADSIFINDSLGHYLSPLSARIHQVFDQVGGSVNRFQQHHPPLPSDLQPKGNLVIVVSHPHGCGKYVSLGEYTSRQIVDDTHAFYRLNPPAFYVYTVHTCPGSSGGPVFVLSKENVGKATNWVHSKFLRRCKLSRTAMYQC